MTSEDIGFLDPLLKYHFDDNHLPSSTAVLGTHLALLSFSIIAAGFLYEKLAMDFAHSEEEGYLNVAGTCYSACLVLVVTTINAYNRHVAPQYVSNELSELLASPLTTAEYYRDSAIILMTSAICSVPFVTIASAIGLLSGPGGWALAAVIFIANMLLHCDPVKLNMSHPLYGILPTLLKKIFLFLICHQQTEEQKEAQKNKETIVSNMQQLTWMLSNGWEHYLDKKITQQESDPTMALDNLPAKSSDFFQLILSEYREVPQIHPTWMLSARAFGIVIEWVGCVGYLANPYIVLNPILGPVWAPVASTLPSYMLGTLLAYFGEMTAMITLMLALMHGPNVVRESAFTRLYPKTMYSLMTLNLFLSTFSAAAAKYTIQLAFPDLPWGWKAMLYVCAQIATTIVSFVVPNEYEKDLGGSISRLYSADPFVAKVMKQNEQFKGFLSDLSRIKSVGQSDQLLKFAQENCYKTPENSKDHLPLSFLHKWFSWCYVDTTVANSGEASSKTPLLGKSDDV